MRAFSLGSLLVAGIVTGVAAGEDLPRPGFFTISQIKQHAASFNVYQTTGYVVKIYTCPPCQPDALCKPCMEDNIVISEKRARMESYDGVGPTELIVFTPETGSFRLGQEVNLVVRVRNSRSTRETINDVELVSAGSSADGR